MEAPVHDQHKHDYLSGITGYSVGPSFASFKKSFGIALVSLAGIFAAGTETQAREFVSFSQNYPSGTIIIKQSERKLYFTTGSGTAVRYPIAVGRAGKAWLGATYVQGKYIRPAWEAPWVVRRDHPQFTSVIPGGSPRNPMGAAAITLGRSEVAIHGTTASMRRTAAISW